MLSTFAPASSAALTTSGWYVSTETRMPSLTSRSMTGTRLATCVDASTRAARTVLDSAPMSTMSAPSAAMTAALRTAESVETAMLSR